MELRLIELEKRQIKTSGQETRTLNKFFEPRKIEEIVQDPNFNLLKGLQHQGL